jgi:hypothetical protein
VTIKATKQKAIHQIEIEIQPEPASSPIAPAEEATISDPVSNTSEHGLAVSELVRYQVDLWQRSILFWMR